jgi:uncharacterized membrane protein YdjX (TVP38/TMEM64 family)
VSRTAKIVLAVALIATLVVGLARLPVGPWVREIVTWVRDQGALGVVVYSLLFIAVSILLLPSLELTLAAGMLYGTIGGALLVTVVALITELLTQALCHTRLRKSIEARIQKYPRIAALDKGLEHDSFWILLLLRFSPVLPFGPLNYALSMTRAPLWERLLANFLGMLPCSLMLAYFGSFLTNTAQLEGHSPSGAWKHIAIWSGITATVVAGWLAARATQHVIDGEQAAHG